MRFSTGSGMGRRHRQHQRMAAVGRESPSEPGIKRYIFTTSLENRMSDPYDLQRFVEAQNPVYAKVCSELREGRKRNHWMWFVFPQIAGLGSSPLARKFAISSLAEAAAYSAHPILGPRL